MEIKISSRRSALFALLAAAILWSTAGLLIKLISWDSIAIGGARSAIAALLILAMIKRPSWNFNIILGAALYTIASITFVVSTKMTTAANAIALQFTAPVWVAMLSTWLLKEKVTLKDYTIIFLVLTGISLFFLDDLSKGSFLGDIVGLISGIAFALQVIYMRKQKDQNPVESVFWGNVFSAIIGIPFYVSAGIPDGTSLMFLIVLGVFQLGLAYVLFSAAIKHVSALEGVLIPTLEVVLNPIWVFLTIGEMPTHLAIIGAIIVVIPIVLKDILNLRPKK